MNLLTGFLACWLALASANLENTVNQYIRLYGPVVNKHIGPCEDTYLQCACGTDLTPSIDIEIPQCRHTLWKKDCKPCRGSEEQEICPKFRNCKECAHQEHCTSCPPGMTGVWCTKRKVISNKSCGKSLGRKKPTIVNGTVSEIGQWPWHAGLAFNVNDKWIITCGGALLARHWVVTAAHCVTYRHTTKLMDTSQFKIYLGKHYRDDYKDDTRVQTFRVKAIIPHPDFHPQSLDSDLALIQLSHAARFTPIVMPICLPDPSEVDIEDHLQEKSTGVVTGWGIEGKNLKASTVLKYARLPIVSKRKCEDGYEKAKSPLTITTNMYCAGFSHGQIGTCSGDSGGPMVFETGYGPNRKYFLMGLLSWSSVNGCALPEQYSGFTLVYEFLDWINSYI